jgi:hypothetical protein
MLHRPGHQPARRRSLRTCAYPCHELDIDHHHIRKAIAMPTPSNQRRTPVVMRQIFISHRKLAVLLVVDLVFFVIAELTYQNAKHPGTASNIAWYAFLIGAASLVVLVIVAIMPRSRRLTR